MFAYRNTKLELSGVAESQRVTGTFVSPGFFDVLGVGPVKPLRLPPRRRLELRAIREHPAVRLCRVATVRSRAPSQA